MIWITIVAVLSLVIMCLIWKSIALVLGKIPSLLMDTGSFIDLVMDYPRTFITCLVLSVCVGIYSVKYQIHEMYTCSVRGTVQKVETQYTWYFDKCQFKNKNGVFIDFDKVRGNPGDEDGSTE